MNHIREKDENVVPEKFVPQVEPVHGSTRQRFISINKKYENKPV